MHYAGGTNACPKERNDKRSNMRTNALGILLFADHTCHSIFWPWDYLLFVRTTTQFKSKRYESNTNKKQHHI